MRSDLGDKKVPRLSRGEKWIAGEPRSGGQKDRLVGGCGSGIDSESGERKSGFSDRASWFVLGEFGVGSRDAVKTDSRGEEIGGGNLFLSSSIRCSS